MSPPSGSYRATIATPGPTQITRVALSRAGDRNGVMDHVRSASCSGESQTQTPPSSMPVQEREPQVVAARTSYDGTRFACSRGDGDRVRSGDFSVTRRTTGCPVIELIACHEVPRAGTVEVEDLDARRGNGLLELHELFRRQAESLDQPELAAVANVAPHLVRSAQERQELALGRDELRRGPSLAPGHRFAPLD